MNSPYNIVRFWEYIFIFLNENGEEQVNFITELSTAIQNAFSDVLLIYALKNANIACIYFVEDKIWFGQGERGPFVSKGCCKRSERKCMFCLPILQRKVVSKIYRPSRYLISKFSLLTLHFAGRLSVQYTLHTLYITHKHKKSFKNV